MNSRMFRQI